MELIPQNLSIDFVGKRKVFMTASAVLVGLILVCTAIFGLNWGVDFAGGSEIEAKFAGPIDAAKVRTTMEKAGFEDASVQEIGAASEHSFLIRVGRVAMTTPEAAAKGEQALKAKYGDALTAFDFNPEKYGDKIEVRLRTQVPATEIAQTLTAAGVQTDRVEPVQGGFTVYTSGISQRVQAAFDEASVQQGTPKAELRRVEFVGPQVGRDLRNKGILSVFFAALAILIYIAFRFDTKFAPGAIVAMFHDIFVVLGYYLVSRREFNLTSVAVLLTIVGYSVNDTIVIYDRIREDMAKMRGMSLASLINRALNETMGRTIITSLVTFLSLIGLLIFGVGQIWDFAAAMTVGLISGVYSTIYIASPMTIWLEDVLGKKAPSASSPASAAKAG